MRILLVEDESDMASLITAALAKQSIVVDNAATLAIAEEAVLNYAYDAILLDRMLPDGDSLTAIPGLRKANAGVPIIILSALSSLDNRVEGLDQGADDYLPKPFSIDELLARLRAVMRRPAQMEQDVVRVGSLEFELTQRQVRIKGEPVSLPRRELLALEALMRRSGRSVSREALEEAVYGFDDEIASNALDAHISRLRRKLEPAGVEIHGIRGIGYLIRAGK